MSESALHLAISPCPNDTFTFEHWIEGKLSGVPKPQTTFADVQTLNELAQRGGADVVKISAGSLRHVLTDYEVLRAGGAMGYGCGPLLLSSGNGPFRKELPTWLPGRDTTATLLFRHWFAATHGRGCGVDFLPFDLLYQGLLRGQVRQGVVIHEHRFTWRRDGLHLVQDLGAWWEEATGSPIPLGVIVARKALGAQRIADIEAVIRASLDAAWARPQLISPFIQALAQEPEPEVMEAHIRTFVNGFSADIGPEGEKALKILLEVAENPSMGPLRS